MTRRQPQPSDSLEMLLDTMCNTFGGIILIALLIALLARENKVSEAERQRVAESSGALEAQIQEAEKELARTKQLQTELEARTADPAQAGALKLIEERQRLRQKSALLDEVARASADAARAGSAVSQEQVIAQMQAMTATNRDAEQKLIEQRNLGTSLLGRLEELKRGVQTESNRLAQVTAQQVQRMRLPREHPTTKINFNIIVRYGQLYPMHVFRGARAELNTTSLRFEPEDATTKRIIPLRGLGINLREGTNSLNALLREVSPDQVYFVFFVYEDSFAEFNALKPMVVQRRFEFTWVPHRNDDVLRLYTGANRPPAPPPPPQ